MATTNLGRVTEQIDTSLDGIVIVRCLGDIPGGRTLDVSGLDASVTTLAAGHVIVKTAKGEYKPLGVSNKAYAAVRADEKVVGVLRHSILVRDPRAAILTMGQVNAAAAEKAVGAPYTTAITSALPRIEFLNA